MNIRLIHSEIRRTVAGALATAALASVTVFSGGIALGQSGAIPQGAGAFGPATRVVPASSVPTAADARSRTLPPGSVAQAIANMSVSPQADRDSIRQVSYGCQSCGQAACGGCNSYGGAFDQSMACGIPCDPYNYAIVEGLFIDRAGEDNFSLTRNADVEEFDFEFAPRITIGTLPNCVNGYEFTWVGPLEYDRALTVFDAGGNLDSVLFDGDGPVDPNNPNPFNFDGTFLDPFNDANIQTQSYTSDYWSAEVNRTVVGWDVVKVLCGARFIRIEEDLVFASQKDIFSSNADLTSRTENSLVGLQAGLDMLNPIGRFLYTDLRARGGLYINFVETDVRLRNQGITVINSGGDDEELAGVFEFAGKLRYQLGELLSIWGGVEAWYLTNVATAPNQITNAVTNNLGRGVDINDDIFYYGVTVGGELRF